MSMPEVGTNSSGIARGRRDLHATSRRRMSNWPRSSARAASRPTRYSVGDRGLHSVTEQPRQRDDISLPRYLGYSDAAARNVAEAATPADRDRRLIDYFKVRKLMGEVIHRFFGDPGLQVAAARYAGPEHEAAIALLRQRLTDPGFASALSPLERAELELLAAAPLDFISCTARRAQAQKKA